MADDMNVACFTGRLTGEPDLRATRSGTSLLRFSIAVNRSHKEPDGRWDEVADYVDCVVAGPRADALARCMAKGQKVAVMGPMRLNRWTGKDGQARSRLELLCSSVVLPDRQARGGEVAGASLAYGDATRPQVAPARPVPHGREAPDWSPALQAGVDASMAAGAPAATMADDGIPF